MHFPVGRHDPCRRCKSVHTVTRRDEVITPYGSRPDTQGNNHNRPAAHCYARQITGAQSCGKKKKESADLQSTLSSFLAANATLSGAKESWGVARGDRKPWCPVPFCPRRRVAARPRTPQRATPGCRVGSIPSPPASGRRNGGNFRALPRGDIFILYRSRGTRGIHRRCIPYRARRFRESR